MSWFRQTKPTGVPPDYTGLQLQTSVSTLPIAIIWGQTKASANVIWYTNFQRHSEGGGGKGTTWGYLAATYPAQALAYQGTAFVCAANYALGDNASIGNHNFEIVGLLAGTGVNGVDADPAQVIADFLTNPQYGAGFDPASLDATTLFGASGDASLQTYCRALGIAFSPALNSQEQASSVLTRWLQIVNCAAVWSGGRLRFIPYADAPIPGGSHAATGDSFAPNVTPIYDLGDADFVDEKGDKDPLQAARADPWSLPTIQRVECLSRANEYASVPVEARDQSQIERYGVRVGTTIQAHEICDEINVGPIVAQTILQRQLYVRARYAFKLSWEYCLLDPMDVVTINDVHLGLNACPVRIVALEEDEKGLIAVTAEELTAGVSTPVLYPVASTSGNVVNHGVAAAPVNPPLIFEPPAALTGGAAQIWVGASGGANGQADPNWGGASVWLSLDDASYSRIATIAQLLRQGRLTRALPAANGWDVADSLNIDVTESGATLSGATAAAAQQGATRSLVDGEVLAYESATLTGANAYALTGLQRGLYGTAGAAHAAGASFARLDQAIVAYDLPANFIGRRLHFKFQSFNLFGLGAEDLSTCEAFAFTPLGISVGSPIATQLSGGVPLDLGAADAAPTLADDFGALLGAVSGALDLGVA